MKNHQKRKRQRPQHQRTGLSDKEANTQKIMPPPEVAVESEEKKVNLRESMASICTIQAKVNQKIRQPPSEGSPSVKGDNTASFNGSYKNS